MKSDSRFKLLRPTTLLAFHPAKPHYPIKETLYNAASSYVRASSQKYDYKQFTSSAKKIKLCLTTANFDASKPTLPTSSRLMRGQRKSDNVSFSEMVKLSLIPTLVGLLGKEASTKQERQTEQEKVFDFIIRQAAKVQNKRQAASQRSLPKLVLKPQVAPLESEPVCLKRIDDTSPKELIPQLDVSPTAGFLSARKQIRRVKDLPKLPFGTHISYTPDFKSRYIVCETTSDWVNINNSKR
jgi:hypothetical protein